MARYSAHLRYVEHMSFWGTVINALVGFSGYALLKYAPGLGKTKNKKAEVEQKAGSVKKQDGSRDGGVARSSLFEMLRIGVGIARALA